MEESAFMCTLGSRRLGGRGGRLGARGVGTHKHTLIFLHSCHGAPYHAQGFLEDLGVSQNGLRVVAPCAPKRPSGTPAWGDTFQWFEYSTDKLMDGQGVQDDAHVLQLRQQRKRLTELLESELSRLPPHGRLVLTGLSQGASMALDLLLHACNPPDAKLRGVVARRGMLQLETLEDLKASLHVDSLAQLRGISILATHGDEDDLVPIEAARESYAYLKDFGASLHFSLHMGMGHTGYDESEGEVLSKFVRKLFYN